MVYTTGISSRYGRGICQASLYRRFSEPEVRTAERAGVGARGGLPTADHAARLPR